MKPRWPIWAGLPVLYVVLETLWAVHRGAGLPLPLWFYGLSLGLALAAGVLIGGLHVGLNHLAGRTGLPVVLAALAGVLIWKLRLVLPQLTPLAVILLLLPLLVPCLRYRSLNRLPRGASLLLLFAVLVSTDLVEGFGRAAAEGRGEALLWVGSWWALVLLVSRPPEKPVRPLRGVPWTGILLISLAGLVPLAAYGWFDTQRPIPWRLNRDYAGPSPGIQRRSDRAPGDLPNILLISVDALRWDGVPPHLSSLPHLDSLRRDSIEFTRMISTSSWTRPAHASLFTGRLPSEHRSTLYGLDRMDTTLPTYTQYLRKIGYHTAGFTGGGPLHAKRGFARGFDRYEHQPVKPYEDFVPGPVEALAWWLRNTRYRFVHEVGPPAPDQTRRRALLYPSERRLRYFDSSVRRARHWLRGVRNSERPWFLFLHTFQVHDYHQLYPASRRWLQTSHPGLYRDLTEFRRTTRRSPSGCLESRSPRHLRQFVRRRLREGPDSLENLYRRLLGMTSGLAGLKGRKYEQISCLAWARPSHWKALHHLYRQGIRSLDEDVGTFLEFLRREDLYDSTLIVFVSDHGEGFALQSGAFVHAFGQLDELLLRVPAWIKLPGPREEHVKRHQLLEITDVFPMVLDHLGLELRGRHPFQADDRTNPLSSRSGGARTVTRGSIQSFLGNRHRAFARGKRYRAVGTTGEEVHEYFRVAADTLSETPVEPAEVPPRVRENLEASIRDVFTLIREGRSPSPEPAPPEDREPPLKGLGYF